MSHAFHKTHRAISARNSLFVRFFFKLTGVDRFDYFNHTESI